MAQWYKNMWSAINKDYYHIIIIILLKGKMCISFTRVDAIYLKVRASQYLHVTC